MDCNLLTFTENPLMESKEEQELAVDINQELFEVSLLVPFILAIVSFT